MTMRGRPAPGALAWALLLAAAVPAAAARAPRARPAPPPFGTFEVTAGAGGRELAVEARFEGGTGEHFSFESRTVPFVTGAQIWRGGAWKDAAVKGDGLAAPGCGRAACRVRYTFQLEKAARSINDHGTAFVHGQAVLAPASTWLVRPDNAPSLGRPPASTSAGADGAVPPEAGRYRLHVSTPEGLRFVTGLFPVRGLADTYALDQLEDAPYAGFAAFELREARAHGGAVQVAIAPGTRALSTEEVAQWVERCATVVADYYGRAPLPRYTVIVLVGSRRPVGFGTAMGYGGGAILVWIGGQASAQDLRQSWVLVHEMAHLAFPNVPRRQHWMEEGLATYVEPLARVRAGLIGEDEFWGGLVRGLPNGLLRPGEEGLDNARRWGPLYWGGALFWFMADVQIREQTHNRKSLEDALRGIQAAGGSMTVWWAPERALAEGDKATGVHVLRELYDSFGRAYMDVDLDRLWARLGVGMVEGKAVKREAPLAAVREALVKVGAAQ